MPGLIVNLLGPLIVIRDGQPISFSYDKPGALLAYLCVEHTQPAPRSRLAGLLWPDQSQSSAQNSLRQAISRLRHELNDREAQPPFLTVERDSIQINLESDLVCDLFQFQQILARTAAHHHRSLHSCITCAKLNEDAACLIRGGFLEDLYLPNSDLFEDWIAMTRERIQIQELEVLENLARFYDQRGDTHKVLNYAERQIALDPYSESACRLVMLNLARSGQRSQAVVRYNHLQQLLESELGISPSTETQALFALIKAERDLPDPSSQEIQGLPTPLTPLVGRVVELSELDAWFSDPDRRLINVFGPGGIGKTRLVNQAIRRVAGMFADGVVYVPLSVPGTGQSLAESVVAALKLPASQATPAWAHIMAYFRGRESLLVLDGFEHFLEERDRIGHLLEAHAGLVVLVTSRERLNLPGEWIFELGGLEVPPPTITGHLDAYSSVLMFCQSARQVSQSFALNEENRMAVSEICRLVGGIPLAIQLAATWTRSLPSQEIAVEIRRSLDILRRQPDQAAGVTENSVRSVFEQSWWRLDPFDQGVFQRLSVFRRGFDRDAAREVAGATLESLRHLVDQSLLRMNLEKRYDLHDLLIQFGAEKLQQSGEETAVRRLHFEYFFTRAKENERQLSQEGKLNAFLWLILEASNLAEALAWARLNEPEQAVQMSGWIHSDYHQAGVHLFTPKPRLQS